MTREPSSITRVGWALIRLSIIILGGVALIAITSELLARVT